MDPFRTPKNPPEEKPVSADPLTRPLEEAQETLGAEFETETEFVEGKVSEIAKERPSETQPSSQKTSQPPPAAQKVQKSDLSDRLALREQLLKLAPSFPVMRKQVEKVLIKRKEKLEKDVKRYRRKRNYHLLSLAIMQLRAVVRQLEELAKASYEALKDIWLKVVHRFA